MTSLSDFTLPSNQKQTQNDCQGNFKIIYLSWLGYGLIDSLDRTSVIKEIYFHLLRYIVFAYEGIICNYMCSYI